MNWNLCISWWRSLPTCHHLNGDDAGLLMRPLFKWISASQILHTHYGDCCTANRPTTDDGWEKGLWVKLNIGWVDKEVEKYGNIFPRLELRKTLFTALLGHYLHCGTVSLRYLWLVMWARVTQQHSFVKLSSTAVNHITSHLSFSSPR